MAHHPLTAPLALALAASVAAGVLIAAPSAARADQPIGYPVFTGPADPVPDEPAPYTPDGMMRAMYEAEAGGTDFWMDRLLARVGADPSGDQWLMTRGRAALMRTHDPSVLGFGGDFAYYDPTFDRFSNQDGYAITVDGLDFTETVAARRQTPSHWASTHTAPGATATVRKFIADENVAVTNLTLANTGAQSRTFALTVTSAFAWQAEGAELTGVLDAVNSRKQPLTTVFPRLSGTGLSPEDGRLTGSVTLAPGESRTVKVQLGMITRELPASASGYASYRADSPAKAFARHVRTYNKWWADNIPYFDVPDPAIKKFIYYRWWLMRFNYLDADIPGNDFQFPTSIEGVTGYNNAIALTVPMFIDDLKYLRDPVYSYGPWVSTGESSGGGRFMDNPGDPENWSNSYTQYIAEAAWRSYQIHGGQAPIAANLAHYAEGDVKGQLSAFDTDGNGLIEYDWGAMTGNDADAVSFHWREGNLDRAESAYQYSGALAAAEAYETIGDTAKAAEMRAIAERIRQAIVDVLWNPERNLFEHRHVASGEHVPWKEINNYYPFSVGAVPNQAPYTDALRLFADPAEYPVFPFYTANQRDKQAAADAGFPGSNNFSQINSTVQFRLFSSVLRDYDTDAITAEDYKKLLYWNAWATYVGGDTRWPDSNEFWADWDPAAGGIDYRSWIHHTTLGSSIWTIVEDAAGLRPRNDDKVELSPIDIGWDHFTVDNLRYRDADLTIVWDQPGDGTRHYPGVPEGYSGFVNGKRVFTVDSLVPLLWDPETGRTTLTGESGKVLYSAPKHGLKAPIEVRQTGPRLVDMFAKAGADLTSGKPNPAAGATATASFTAPGTSTAAAVDGWTVDKPYWGSKGSGQDSDWYALDLGKARKVDEVRLHFLRDRLPGGYAEPASFKVQYLDGSTWTTIPRQAKDPAVPRANYNRVAFAPVTARHFRILMDHQDGHATALKEVRLSATGDRTPPAANTAPYVLARQDFGFSSPAQARLNGVVKDDALPDGGALTRAWSVVDGPGTAIFTDPAAASTVATFTAPGSYRRGRRDRRRRQPRAVGYGDGVVHLAVGERRSDQRRRRPAALERRRESAVGNLAADR